MLLNIIFITPKIAHREYIPINHPPPHPAPHQPDHFSFFHQPFLKAKHIIIHAATKNPGYSLLILLDCRQNQFRYEEIRKFWIFQIFTNLNFTSFINRIWLLYRLLRSKQIGSQLQLSTFENKRIYIAEISQILNF